MLAGFVWGILEIVVRKNTRNRKIHSLRHAFFFAVVIGMLDWSMEQNVHQLFNNRSLVFLALWFLLLSFLTVYEETKKNRVREMTTYSKQFLKLSIIGLCGVVVGYSILEVMVGGTS
jgi:hypothetical protein